MTLFFTCSFIIYVIILYDLMAYIQVDGIKFSANENITNWKHDSWWALKTGRIPCTQHHELHISFLTYCSFCVQSLFYEFGVFMVRWSHSHILKISASWHFRKGQIIKEDCRGEGVLSLVLTAVRTVISERHSKNIFHLWQAISVKWWYVSICDI